MANQIKLVATINPANTAVEASTDSGATFRAVAMSTVGSQQEGILTNVAAGTYAAGVVRLRAVAFPAVLASNAAALTVLNAAAPASRAHFFADGDSLDRGYLTSNEATKNWPVQAALDPAKFSAPVVIAISGQLVSDMLTRQAANLLNAIDRVNYAQAIVTVGGGHNDLMYGRTAAAIKQDTTQYIANIRAWQAANGNFPVKVILESLTRNGKAYGSLSLADYETARVAINADRFSNYAVYGADYYQNYESDINLSDFTNTAYFTADMQHFTDAGQLSRANDNRPPLLAAQAGTALAPLPAAAATAPVISSVTPTTAAVAASVTVTGLRLTSATVRFNGILATAASNTATQIVVPVPSGATTGPLTVTTASGAASTPFTVSTAATTPPPAQRADINRRFRADLLVAQGTGGFTWGDCNGSGDVAGSSATSGITILPAAVNGHPAIRFASTAINGAANTIVSGTQPFQFIAVLRVANTAENVNANLFGVGIDASGDGTIADCIVFGSKLCIHTKGAQHPGENQAVAPAMPFDQFAVVAVWHDGTNGFSYNSTGGASAAKVIYRDPTTPASPIRIGGGHFDVSPADFQAFTADYAEIIVQAFDQAKLDGLIAELRAYYAL